MFFKLFTRTSVLIYTRARADVREKFQKNTFPSVSVTPHGASWQLKIIKIQSVCNHFEQILNNIE